jgi:hypothetical protein
VELVDVDELRRFPVGAEEAVLDLGGGEPFDGAQGRQQEEEGEASDHGVLPSWTPYATLREPWDSRKTQRSSGG